VGTRNITINYQLKENIMKKIPTILAVDDQPVNLRILKKRLLLENYPIITADNGKAAMKIIEKNKPDLILLDVMMPEMSGFEVCTILKSDPKTRSIPIIFLTAKAEPEDIVTGFNLGAVDYISKPFNHAELISRIKTHTELKRLQDNLEQAVADRTSKLNNALDELRGAHYETIKRLARAADYRDNETGMHILRMSHYSRILGKAMGMSEQECDQLQHASAVHDIGKIGISDNILLKPGKLDKVEFEVIKTHSAIGAALLSDIDSDLCRLAEKIALTHHEKWNGTGYPNGLAGTDIPLEGRIAAVADVFDALTSVRPYKKSWSVEDAINLLIKEKGLHFDPEIVDLFVENKEEILAIKEKYADKSAG
jgi:putative two-component system response regulator